MIRYLKRLNSALPGMIAGIILYGLVVELAGIWLVQDKAGYTAGLLIGIVLAIAMAIHMAMVIEDSITVNSKRGQFRIATKGVLRYAVVAVIVFVCVYFDLCNMVTLFIGVMGLKAAAYMQPWFQKLKRRDSSNNQIKEEVSE